MKVVQLLGLQGSWWHNVHRDTYCLCYRSYGLIRVFSDPLVAGYQKACFGQSFSIAPPIQALRGLPCLGSFPVVQYIRHIEGLPWLASYSVDQCISHLKEDPGWGSALKFSALGI